MINTAEDYILIQSPYFVPDESILEGAENRPVIGHRCRNYDPPTKPDHIFIYWVTLAYVGGT